ncbi:acetyl-coenzyme A thioesterase [Oncorhynchus mykiss]|uniref:acetyl-coenzyme A thioesterase n=1 Tax=Oncorhynchus mykiss TaxID=8022 RepID=UPI001878C455|nr:acetyl-coenzyme A thioesterase [Oncorhynchus mykiss]
MEVGRCVCRGLSGCIAAHQRRLYDLLRCWTKAESHARCPRYDPNWWMGKDTTRRLSLGRKSDWTGSTLYIIISCNQTEVPLSVPWDISNQVSLHTLENQMLCFKVETHVNVPAEQAFHLLSDLRRRHEWDRHYPQCDVIVPAERMTPSTVWPLRVDPYLIALPLRNTPREKFSVQASVSARSPTQNLLLQPGHTGSPPLYLQRHRRPFFHLSLLQQVPRGEQRQPSHPAPSDL